MESLPSRKRPAASRLKRAFDLVLTFPVLLIIIPVLILVALLVRLLLGKPVFYRQERPGLHAKPFRLWKFRTMTDHRDAQGQLLPDEQRLTRFSGFLRAASLDEWPELFNVLKGEMSLVGPRPLLMRYLPRYNAEQFRRHEALPGITGWAQINGRNALSWEEKFAFDVWYIDHWSFWLDVRILAITALRVFRRQGISEPGHATMSEFMGTGRSTKPD